MVSGSFEVDAEDITYVTHNGVPLGARLYRPRGPGPFPAMVDAHGGAWILGTYVNNDSINRRVASGGIVVMAIDYLLPPDGTYPSSVADVNFAIRWLKQHAAEFRARPDWVGAMGTSSGGHLAVLAALKPRDPRYAALPLEHGEGIDASVKCVVAMWPVICPATRFEENLERRASGDQTFVDRVGGGLDQMKYWLTKEAMVDGSPMLAVERGDEVELPPVLYIQALCDILHPRHCMERFCAAYAKHGAYAEPLLIEGEPYDFLRSELTSPESRRAISRIVEFVRSSTGAGGSEPASASAH